jgi:hypothetical protein
LRLSDDEIKGLRNALEMAQKAVIEAGSEEFN